MPMLMGLIIALGASPLPEGKTISSSPRGAAPTEEGMREYFAGEKRESFVFIAAGVASLGVGIPLVIEGRDVGRPMSVPLMAVGLVHLVLGVGLLVRTPGQVSHLADQLQREPSAWKEAEGKRMRGVMGGFQLYRLVELTLGTAGAFMAGIGYVRESPAACGVGLGLLIEAATLLALDFFAEERGRKYSALIADFIP